MSAAIQDAPDDAPVVPLTRAHRWAVIAVLMVSSFMVGLDTTIANVALPHMQAALGATRESVAWVLTSYIVTTAILIPLTGWLTDRLGQRLLFTICIAGFTVSSLLCGVARSLPMMILARVLQGGFAASLNPIAQALMYDISPRSKQPQAMMIWGIVAMIAPVTGPVIGGWLTDTYDWRWVFYINLPIGVIASLGAYRILPNAQHPARRFDLAGFMFLALGLGALQLLLDRGTQIDWFDATEAWIEAGLVLSATWMLVVHLYRRPDGIVPAALLADRNYLTATLFMAYLGAVTVAGAALVTPMLQTLMGYPVITAGVTVAPRGIGAMLGFIVAARLMRAIDPRIVMLFGMAMLVASLHMMTGFSLDMDQAPLLVSGLLQGAGTAVVMIATNLLAFSTLAPALRTDAAALYALTRNLGGSIGISVMSALLARNVQVNHAEIGERLTAPGSLGALAGSMGDKVLGLAAVVDAEVNRQAALVAYLDDFWLMMWVAILFVPLAMVMKPATRFDVPVHVGE